MENKITVCVADADQAYRTELCDFLKKQGDICLIGDTADGREALAMVEAQHPAVLVLDTVLPGLDGTGILRRLKGKSETRCIVVTEFRTAEAARDIRDAGAYAFLPKPADDTSVLEHIRHAAGPRCDLPLQQLEMMVTAIIHEIGVPAHIKGYQYLREGIILTVRNMEVINAVTKVLYPEIAKRFSATPACVERAMRHAIEIAWNRGDFEMQQKIFRGTISGAKGKPTNGEFIALLAGGVLLLLLVGWSVYQYVMVRRLKQIRRQLKSIILQNASRSVSGGHAPASDGRLFYPVSCPFLRNVLS